MNEQMIEDIVKQVVNNMNQTKVSKDEGTVPIAVSARHVHLQQAHVDLLFGEGYELTKRQDLSQPGQFAANETVMVAGPKGSITKVRILGPVRPASQVEVSLSDAFALGVKAPLRESGDIAGSSPISLIGPNGAVHLIEGLIIAQAHIHMNPQDAQSLNVTDGQFLQVKVDSARPVTLDRVKVRVSERYKLEMHIDTDEANTGFITQDTIGKIKFPKHAVSSSMHQGHAHPSTKIEMVSQNQPANIKVYEKKLLSEENVNSIVEEEIHISKRTLVTALAYDSAREQGKKIKRV